MISGISEKGQCKACGKEKAFVLCFFCDGNNGDAGAHYCMECLQAWYARAIENAKLENYSEEG